MGTLHGPERSVRPPSRGEGFVRRLLPEGHAAVLTVLFGLRAAVGPGMGPRRKCRKNGHPRRVRDVLFAGPDGRLYRRAREYGRTICCFLGRCAEPRVANSS